MAKLSGGELLARCLATEGVHFAFGLPCPELDPLLAALEGNGIRFVPIRHEAAAAHMAEGVYKTCGQVAAVLGNPGPGSANLLPGVITARHEGVPLVAVTAQHRLGVVYPSPPSTFQGQDQLDAFAPHVKWGGPVFAWDRIAEVTRMAFREMWSGRPGPVQLEVPGPVLSEEREDAGIEILAPPRYRSLARQASESQLEQAAELLAGAERPVVVAGSGVDRAGAAPVLLQLVERLGAPVIPTMSGRAVVPGDHPNYVYGYGSGGDTARREADVVLIVGSRLGNLDLPYDKYWGDPSSQKLIQIDIDERNIGITRPLELAIVADAADTLAGLLRVLEKRGLRRADGAHLGRCREADAAWRAQADAVVESWSGEGIHPARAMAAVGRVFGRDAIYTADGGNTSLWAHWHLPPTRPRSYLNILELGMLGTGIPSAIGAKLANPERDVVCVTGDGAAGFNFMEMQSAAREGLAVTTVVFAEGAWSMEEPNERMVYGRTFGTEMGEVRWDLVAQGLGCAGAYVEKLDDLEPALERAKSAPGPAVICVRTSREANLATPPDALLRFVEVYAGPMG
ncbi:MAG: thiamine pyrophosphate-binding protein [Myxococcota bacterium]